MIRSSTLVFGLAILSTGTIAPPATSQQIASEEMKLPEANFEIDLSNLRTLTELKAMKSEADRELAANGCASATEKFAAAAIQANATANILHAGLNPFYDASRDDREIISRSSKALDPLIEKEKKMNEALKLRNSAWVQEGICKLEGGETEQGVAILNKALSLISVRTEVETWRSAREAIWSLVAE